MKQLLYLFLFLLACCSSKEEPVYLYVVQADGGKIEKVDDKFYLELTDVDPKTIVFSDRPYRDARFLPTADFIEHWDEGDDSFKEDPPNASISAVISDDEGGEQALHIIELMNTKYDERKNQLRFEVISIHDGLPLKETQIESVALFIDSSLFTGRQR